MRDHGRFMRHIAKNWRYAIGLGLMALIAFWQGASGKAVSSWVYWGILFLTLYVVFFKTWQDEHDRVLYLEDLLISEYEHLLREVVDRNAVWNDAKVRAIKDNIVGDEKLIQEAIIRYRKKEEEEKQRLKDSWPLL